MAKLDYKSAGVNYDVLDTFKRACQKLAWQTAGNLARHGLSEPAGIRGESCYILETPQAYIAHVEEALGTKVLVADAVYKLTGQSFYANVAIDNVSTIVNDLATSGALPVTVAMYAALGDAEYLADARRAADLAEGFAEGCRQSGAAWAGGETQVLKGMVNPETVILGGSAMGMICPKSNYIAGDVADGDAIVFVASNGVQTNGLTLCRALADRLPQGYLTPGPDGRPYGQALLDPSVIYVRLVEACQKANIHLHYAVHMTGHGWRKLMRPAAPFVYNIETIGMPQPVFQTIADAAGLGPADMYGTFNMGVGFALYVAPQDAPAVLAAAKQTGYTAWHAGTVQSQNGRKAVEIAPLGITYDEASLNIR
ncbi:MAG: AIR synthase-related protein [Phycisphaerae bacterium]|nr:AIR synthase-related protein [Phycisphaerae bacterium]